MAEWLRWRPGRQHTGYEKLLLFRQRQRFDAYLLRYPEGVGIPMHRDAVEGFRHYRFNVALIKPKRGGLFYCEVPLLLSDRIKFFRSDFEHSVSPVIEGQRVLLSIGWLRRNA